MTIDNKKVMERERDLRLALMSREIWMTEHMMTTSLAGIQTIGDLC
jgi:hypothetical protein